MHCNNYQNVGFCANDRVGAGNIPGACPRRENFSKKSRKSAPPSPPSHSPPHPMLGDASRSKCGNCQKWSSKSCQNSYEMVSGQCAGDGIIGADDDGRNCRYCSWDSVFGCNGNNERQGTTQYVGKDDDGAKIYACYHN